MDVEALYEAAQTGSVASLDALLKRNSVLLHRASVTPHAETPLHLAALLGHLEFSRRLLELKPELAFMLDSEKCTPLHLAAAEGHDHIVRDLLKGAGEEACLMPDQEGRIPLHLAAMRGRVPVVRELLKSKHAQRSVKMKVEDGDSILHLCVKYNNLDVLKVVLSSTGEDDDILKMTDSHGNTVLHLAVMLKHKEMVRFLLELPRIREEVLNTPNNMGFTVLDVLNHSLKDFKTLEIHEILVAVAGAGTALPGPTLGAGHWKDEEGPAEAQEQVNGEARTWRTWARRHVKQLMNYRGDWMIETRGSLMMVSTIIATVTFTAGISPPGGVWQNDTTESYDGTCSNNSVCVAGNAVLAYYYPDKYISFMKYNMVSLISSLMVVFLLISGFPLSNKFCLWLLSVAMCLTISFLGLTFMEALWLVIPGELLDKYAKFKSVSMIVWFLMMTVCGLFLIVRLSYWLGRVLKLLPGNPYANRKTRRVDNDQC